MSDSEFVMTYPCYFPLTKEGNPELVHIDDALCVCLFTDKTLVQAFHNQKHPDDGTGKKRPAARVVAMKSRRELLEFLRHSQADFERAGCGFVAIDVGPGKPLMYCAYAELIAEIEKSG